MMFAIPRPSWFDDALCRGLDPELFFPTRGDSSWQAIAVCEPCPVRAECLDYALDLGERYGIWGGTAEKARKRIRRQRRRERQAS